MQKIIIILGLIIIAGCSTKRAVLPSATDSDFRISRALNVSEVTNLNLTAQSFFIPRADINIAGEGISQSVNATIKFVEPDKYLISVRAFGGLIEAGRIFITSDTILINDRINNTLYYGSNQNVRNKYGFDLMFFPVLLGDLITESQNISGIRNRGGQSVLNCNEGTAVFREIKGGYIINYLIDCETKKPRKVTVENELMRDYVSIEFDNFGKDDEKIFPTRLKINNFANFAKIEMDIRRVEFNVDSNIEFIPGRNFTRVEIK